MFTLRLLQDIKEMGGLSLDTEVSLRYSTLNGARNKVDFFILTITCGGGRMSRLRKTKMALFILGFAAVAGVGTPSLLRCEASNGAVPSSGASSLNQSSTIQVYFRALRGDASALVILRRRANGGNAVAEALLGSYYLSHHDARAFTWLSKATAQDCTIGNDAAQNWLALCYFQGVGTKQNYLAAEKCWRAAASGGNASAAYSLGVMYENGTVLPKRLSKALRWFQIAASNGQASVSKAARSQMQQVSLILAEKMIRAGNYHGAFTQLSSPASQGSAAADYLMGNLYAAGHSPFGGKIQPLPQLRIDNLFQTAAAGEKALKELRRYAHSGDGNAQYALAIWYEHSDRQRKMLYWLSSAAHYPGVGDIMTGNLAAQYRLATLYFSGGYDGLPLPGLPRPIVAHHEGVMLLKLAAGRGYLKAIALLGSLYFGQPYVPNTVFPSRKKAKFWLTQAAAKGDKHATALLAVMAKGGGPKTSNGEFYGLPPALVHMLKPP